MVFVSRVIKVQVKSKFRMPRSVNWPPKAFLSTLFGLMLHVIATFFLHAHFVSKRPLYSYDGGDHTHAVAVRKADGE